MNSRAAVKCVLGNFQIAFTAALDSSVEITQPMSLPNISAGPENSVLALSGLGNPKFKSDHTSVHVTGTRIPR